MDQIIWNFRNFVHVKHLLHTTDTFLYVCGQTDTKIIDKCEQTDTKIIDIYVDKQEKN